MSTINGRGSINDGFAFNNTFFASGDFTQSAGKAAATGVPGYNYLAYTPVIDYSFVIPTVGAAQRYVFSDYVGAGSQDGSAAPRMIISGQNGAGYVFNGQTSVVISGKYASVSVYNVSGVNWSVERGN